MRYRSILFAMLLILAGHAGADDFDAELKRLQSTLFTLNQELAATYSQFQMLMEARRASMQQGILDGPQPGLDYRDYETVVAAQAAARARSDELTRQMDQLLAKAREIDVEKQPILQRVYELLRTSQSAATEAHNAEPQSKIQKTPY